MSINNLAIGFEMCKLPAYGPIPNLGSFRSENLKDLPQNQFCSVMILSALQSLPLALQPYLCKKSMEAFDCVLIIKASIT